MSRCQEECNWLVCPSFPQKLSHHRFSCIRLILLNSNAARRKCGENQHSVGGSASHGGLTDSIKTNGFHCYRILAGEQGNRLTMIGFRPCADSKCISVSGQFPVMPNQPRSLRV